MSDKYNIFLFNFLILKSKILLLSLLLFLLFFLLFYYCLEGLTCTATFLTKSSSPSNDASSSKARGSKLTRLLDRLFVPFFKLLLVRLTTSATLLLGDDGGDLFFFSDFVSSGDDLELEFTDDDNKDVFCLL